MDDVRKAAAYNKELPDVVVPYRVAGESNAVSTNDLRNIVQQINSIFRSISSKIYGHIDTNDLSMVTREIINNKLSGEGVASWILQNPDKINAVVTQEIPRGTEAPSDPEVDDLWMDTSVDPAVVKRWTGTAWSTTGTNSVKTSSVTIDENSVEINTNQFSLTLHDTDSPDTSTVNIDVDSADFDKVTGRDAEFEEIKLAGVPLFCRSANTYYWSPTGTGDGSSASSPANNLQALIDSIPHLLLRDVTIELAANSTYYGDITFYSYLGGSIYLHGTNSKISGVVRMFGCTQIELNHVNVGGVYAEYSGLTIDSCVINAPGTNNPLVMHQCCTGSLINSEINVAGNQWLIWVLYGSRLAMYNCTGDSGGGIACLVGPMGEIAMAGTCPYGTNMGQGGALPFIGSATPTHGSGYAAPPTPSSYTVQIACTGSRSKRSTWRTDTLNIYQGEWETYGNHVGCFWFAGTGVPAGATITGTRLWMRRLNAGGVNQDEPLYLYTLNSPTSDPGNAGSGSAPSLGTSHGNIGAWTRDESQWVSIPIAAAQDVVAGKGLAVYTSSGSNYQVLYGYGTSYPPVLEITYHT